MTAQETRTAPMSILVVGLGVIGTTYGYLFQKAGHHVEHLVRESSTSASVISLEVEILDGRRDPKGSLSQDQYTVHHRGHTSYDLIVVSVPQGRIAEAMAALRTGGIEGPVLLFCGFWGEREELDRLMAGRAVLLGYPVAGGRITRERLTCCVFDHVMLERRDKARFPGYEGVEALFGSCGIGLEHPHDMLEWIWLHMAINAGVGAVAAMHGDVEDTTRAAEQIMGSSRMLAQVVRAIRETSRIVASRGVDLRRYRGELLVYRLPTVVSAPLMKRMFARNLLTQRIMTLHGNTADLLFVCRTVYEQGRTNGLSAPIFYKSYEEARSKAARHDQHLPGMGHERKETT
nr:2-dehydropantoate 2-reductase N-terminal domain-containing protein [Actinomyces naeslundii]